MTCAVDSMLMLEMEAVKSNKYSTYAHCKKYSAYSHCKFGEVGVSVEKPGNPCSEQRPLI